jgi:hypothetical protein
LKQLVGRFELALRIKWINDNWLDSVNYLFGSWRFGESFDLERQLHFFQLLLCYWTCRLSSIRSNVDRRSVKSFSGAMKTR